MVQTLVLRCGMIIERKSKFYWKDILMADCRWFECIWFPWEIKSCHNYQASGFSRVYSILDTYQSHHQDNMLPVWNDLSGKKAFLCKKMQDATFCIVKWHMLQVKLFQQWTGHNILLTWNRSKTSGVYLRSRFMGKGSNTVRFLSSKLLYF